MGPLTGREVASPEAWRTWASSQDWVCGAGVSETSFAVAWNVLLGDGAWAERCLPLWALEFPGVRLDDLEVSSLSGGKWPWQVKGSGCCAGADYQGTRRTYSFLPHIYVS